MKNFLFPLRRILRRIYRAGIPKPIHRFGYSLCNVGYFLITYWKWFGNANSQPRPFLISITGYGTLNLYTLTGFIIYPIKVSNRWMISLNDIIIIANDIIIQPCNSNNFHQLFLCSCTIRYQFLNLIITLMLHIAFSQFSARRKPTYRLAGKTRGNFRNVILPRMFRLFVNPVIIFPPHIVWAEA